MSKEVITKVDADVRRYVAGRIEKHEISKLKIFIRDGNTHLELFCTASRQLSSERVLVDRHGVSGTIYSILILTAEPVRNSHHL